eukprot:760727-Hanusia_phi.AAC.2
MSTPTRRSTRKRERTVELQPYVEAGLKDLFTGNEKAIREKFEGADKDDAAQLVERIKTIMGCAVCLCCEEGEEWQGKRHGPGSEACGTLAEGDCGRQSTEEVEAGGERLKLSLDDDLQTKWKNGKAESKEEKEEKEEKKVQESPKKRGGAAKAKGALKFLVPH